MNTSSCPGAKLCPKCRKSDETEFSTCRYCGTRYDWQRPEIHETFDLGSFLRTGSGLFIVLLFCCVFLKPIRNLAVRLATHAVITDSAGTISSATRELQANPSDYNALLKRADAESVLFRSDKALADCNAAINLRPNDRQGYLARAHVYESLGQMDQAANDQTRANALNR